LLIGGGVAVLLGVMALSLSGKSPPAAPVAPAPRAPASVEAPPAPTTPAPVAATKASLKITVDAADATIELDENVIAEHASSATVTLGFIGTHVVTATAPGRKPVTKVITVVEGEAASLALTLPKTAVARPRPAASKKNSDYMLDPFAKH
jgi:hypothetical protein